LNVTRDLGPMGLWMMGHACKIECLLNTLGRCDLAFLSCAITPSLTICDPAPR
jgi:hypothetical protein